MNLSELRVEIDLVDAEFVKLIERRTQIAVEIGRLKAKAGLQIVDESRENEVINRACCDHDHMVSKSIARIYRTILKESRSIQLNVAKTLIKTGSVTGR